MTASMNDKGTKPGIGSYGAVFLLLVEAVLDLLLLPFRFARFLVNRKSICLRIRNMITDRTAVPGKE